MLCGSSRAPLSDISRHRERMRALPAGRQTARANARFAGSHSGWCRNRLRLHAGRATVPRASQTTRHANRRSGEGNCTGASRHGCCHHTLRSPIRRPHPAPRSSGSWSTDHAAMAQISLGARQASCEADMGLAESESCVNQAQIKNSHHTKDSLLS